MAVGAKAVRGHVACVGVERVILSAQSMAAGVAKYLMHNAHESAVEL